MWIDIDGSKFNTDHIACIRPVDADSDNDDDDQCVIFMTGQSAMDGGFLIDLPLDEVFEAVQTPSPFAAQETPVTDRSRVDAAVDDWTGQPRS